MKKLILFAYGITVVSCCSLSFSERCDKLQIGMTKLEVTKIMGKGSQSEEVLSNRKGELVEAIHYESKGGNRVVVHMVDGKVEFISKYFLPTTP